MKRFIFLATVIVVSFVGVQAHAQIQSDVVPGEIKYTYLGKFKNVEGVTLSKEDLANCLGTVQYVDYANGVKKLKSGYICTGLGVAGIVGGSLLSSSSGASDSDDYGLSEGLGSIVLVVGGVVLTAIGVPKLFIAHSRLKNVAKSYNSQQNVSFNFGGQEHGIGFALNF